MRMKGRPRQRLPTVGRTSWLSPGFNSSSTGSHGPALNPVALTLTPSVNVSADPSTVLLGARCFGDEQFFFFPKKQF